MSDHKKDELSFLQMELRDIDGMSLGEGTGVNNDSTLEEIKAFQNMIIDRHKKGEKTFIDFEAGFFVDDDFIEHMEGVVIPMQDVEKVKFYFLSSVGASCHKGILNADIPEADSEQ